MKVVICLTFALISFSAATDFCRKDLCGAKVKHIACGNSGQLTASCPKNAKFHDLNKHSKEIVSHHNYYRNSVASGLNGKFPMASRMATMIWDKELANLAGLNVKTCIFAHDRCRNTDKFQHSGQNLAYTSTSGNPELLKTVLQHIDSWFAENKYVKLQHLKQFEEQPKPKIIGHFTAMVTDRSFAIGCAAVEFMKPMISKGHLFNMTTVLTACNYASTNFGYSPGFAIPVYEFGKPTSKCKTGHNPSFPKLCSEKEQYDVNSLERYLTNN